jgi:transcriptional repressor NrdR
LKRFTTYERIENVSLIVIKKDGRREKFDREKLKNGVVRAAEKRPVSMELLEGVVSEIEQELLNKDSTEISSKVIGNLVLKRLKKIDKVAYVRFASVYLDFGDLEDFERIIEKLT